MLNHQKMQNDRFLAVSNPSSDFSLFRFYDMSEIRIPLNVIKRVFFHCVTKTDLHP